MLRKIIDAQQSPVVLLNLPKNLIGKRIEVIAFEIEEEPVKEQQSTMADFFGIMPNEDAGHLQAHVKQARTEWERNF